MNDVIITVHGVGEAAPGATLSCLENVLAQVVTTAYQDAPLVFNGRTYQRRLPLGPEGPELVEMNWADVRKPGRTVFGFLRHLPALAVAALDVDHAWLGAVPAPPPVRLPYILTQRLYGIVLKSFALWAGFPVLLAIGYTSLYDGNPWAFGLGLIALAACMTWVMRGWGRPIVIGGAAWVVVLAGLTGSLKTEWLAPERLSRWSAIFCGGTQLLAGLLLAALGVEVVLAIARDPARRVHYLSYLGMNYSSLLLLAMLGSFLWAVTLNALNWVGPLLGRTGPLVPDSWSEIFLRYIGYDLRAGEFAMLAATLVSGLLVGISFTHYWLAYRGHLRSGSAGNIARQWYRRLLIGLPILLLIPGVALLLTCPLGRPLGQYPPNVDALMNIGLVNIYTISALRLAALLPALAPRVATVLGVMGDVVFYTARPGTTLSIRETCNERLHNLLTHYTGRNDIRSICVVGHSQGSVIAFEVLSALTRPQVVSMRLVTMGSPLCTLYGDFLGLQFSTRPAPWFGWINLYRNGDYIGGSVPQLAASGNDINLGDGEHSGYWSDPRILPYVCSEAEAKDWRLSNQ